jgi:hypothetical protein
VYISVVVAVADDVCFYRWYGTVISPTRLAKRGGGGGGVPAAPADVVFYMAGCLLILFCHSSAGTIPLFFLYVQAICGSLFAYAVSLASMKEKAWRRTL